jgi:16S rRNA (uracil1498-N3)-methyltransferase
MAPGDEIAVLDNSGREYRVRLATFSRGLVEGDVVAVHDEEAGWPVEVVLYQGLLKGDKFQWVLQKATELGAAAFVPVVCRRSVPGQSHKGSAGRYPRWTKVIVEAAEQSGGRILPQLRESLSFQQACAQLDPSHTSIVPWERESSVGLRRALEGAASRHVNIFIGPEGGLEEDEVEYARSRGVVPVSLGSRVLRSETAAIAAVSGVLYHLGQLGC